MLSAPRKHLTEIEKLLSRDSLSPRWFVQPASPASFQFRTSANLSAFQAAQLATTLSSLCFAFEIAQFAEEGSLYLFTRELGLKRLSIDGAGEVTLRAGQVGELLQTSKRNFAEFERLLRQAQGTVWLDALEPLRQGRPRVERLLGAI